MIYDVSVGSKVVQNGTLRYGNLIAIGTWPEKKLSHGSDLALPEQVAIVIKRPHPLGREFLEGQRIDVSVRFELHHECLGAVWRREFTAYISILIDCPNSYKRT